MALREITGTLSAWGASTTEKDGSSGYAYLRFDTNDGSDGYIENVMTLPKGDSFLRGGSSARTFYFATVNAPRIFGTRRLNVLYAVRDHKCLHDDSPAVQASFGRAKMQGVAIILLGVALAAFSLWPASLVLWVWGGRILFLGLPVSKIRSVLATTARA